MNFGEFVQTKRKSLGLTLRQFCENKGYDPAYISRVENGLTTPPQDKQKLEALARALEIKPETKAWVDFFDTASISRGQLPEDIQRRMPDLVTFLPMFCRKLGNKKLTDEDLDKIIKLLAK